MTARPLLAVRVNGIPRPQGSLTPYGTSGSGKVRFSHSDLLLEWRADVVAAVQAALPADWAVITHPVVIRLSFAFTRPKRHFTANGRLRPDAPYYMSVGTDLDKLVRAIFDALTVAGVWDDDKRVAIERSEKHYSETPGVTIELWPVQE